MLKMLISWFWLLKLCSYRIQEENAIWKINPAREKPQKAFETSNLATARKELKRKVTSYHRGENSKSRHGENAKNDISFKKGNLAAARISISPRRDYVITNFKGFLQLRRERKEYLNKKKSSKEDYAILESRGYQRTEFKEPDWRLTIPNEFLV